MSDKTCALCVHIERGRELKETEEPYEETVASAVCRVLSVTKAGLGEVYVETFCEKHRERYDEALRGFVHAALKRGFTGEPKAR